MTEKVFCKNCKYLGVRDKYSKSQICRHPSLWVKVTKYHPISGSYTQIVMDCQEYEEHSYTSPYDRNRYFDCTLYEEKFLVKVWNIIKKILVRS